MGFFELEFEDLTCSREIVSGCVVSHRRPFAH
jgi:hypothetical protein